MTRLIRAACAALVLLLVPATSVHAQDRPARLLLTVVDQTGAVIPDAVVTLSPAAEPARLIGPVKSTDWARSAAARTSAFATGR